MTFNEHMWEGHVSADVHCVLTALPCWYSLQLDPQPLDSGQKTLHVSLDIACCMACIQPQQP